MINTPNFTKSIIAKFTFSLLLVGCSLSSFGQKKYQSLLWEITGNGVEKPSYLYGTMHVSSKLAFYLGNPFFDALESVEQVALELEPELWFDEVLGGDFMSNALGRMGGGNYYGNEEKWNSFEGNYKIEKNTNLLIQSIFKQDPEMANQLLFRFYDPSGNFEEDTWLDMYIYQSAKKLGKSTLGLETFEESMKMLSKSQEESRDEENPARSLSNEDRMEIPIKIESAYRNGDLDLLDSLGKLSSPPSYLKYILIERNKNFVRGLDSLIRQKPIFAGMGAAHLPGDEGCIEMLRELGFTVKPIAPGKRDGKQKKKIESMVLKRPLKDFTSSDGVLSFKAPSKVYDFSLMKGSSSLITMDVPNGSVTTITRLVSNSGFTGRSIDYIKTSLDSLLFETIPGEIKSKKEIKGPGYLGFDILNQTRKGDFHRCHIYFLPDEIIILRSTANGKKIKKGFNDEFFNSIKINIPKNEGWVNHSLLKGSLKFSAPGRLLSYSLNEKTNKSSTVFIQKNDNGEIYNISRFRPFDKGYLDFDSYEIGKLTSAFAKDMDLNETSREWVNLGKNNALKVNYTDEKGKAIYGLFALRGLGYYSFMAHTEKPANAERFFNSIELAKPTYSTYFEEVDSTLYFRTQIPWEKEKSGTDKYFSRQYYYSPKKVNLAEAYYRTKSITPPGTADWLSITYNRHGKYEFVEDVKELPNNLKNLITDDNDLVLDSSYYNWTKDGIEHFSLASDTGTSRKYFIKRILINRSLWTITSTFDSIDGESEFAQMFRDNFEALEDTLSFSNFYVESDSILLADLMSEDTNTFENAYAALEDLRWDYENETNLKFYTALTENPPSIASDEQKDEFLTAKNDFLFLDNSSANIAELKKIYRANPDSAVYQQQMLGNLTKMKTRKAILAAKELMMEEAPIGVSFNFYTGVFKNLSDSLELAKLLYPEILELTAYDEYKYNVIKLLGRMVDSNVVNKNLYASYVPYFVREARAQIRRLSSNDGAQVTSTYSRKNKLTNYSMYNYWVLLRPFKNHAGPRKVFEISKNSNKKHVMEAYASFNHNHKIKITDVVCDKLYDDENPIDSYFILDRIGRADYLPDSVSLAKEHIKKLISNDWSTYSYRTVEIDTIIFVSEHVDSIRAINYNTFYFKYLKETYGKKKWYYSVVMMKTTKSTKPEFEDFHKFEVEKPSLTEEEHFELLKNKLIASKRNNKTYGGSGSYNYEESLLLDY